MNGTSYAVCVLQVYQSLWLNPRVDEELTQNRSEGCSFILFFNVMGIPGDIIATIKITGKSIVGILSILNP
jgi:hypothetical protein